jgi:hypothetical protein
MKFHLTTIKSHKPPLNPKIRWIQLPFLSTNGACFDASWDGRDLSGSDVRRDGRSANT